MIETIVSVAAGFGLSSLMIGFIRGYLDDQTEKVLSEVMEDCFGSELNLVRRQQKDALLECRQLHQKYADMTMSWETAEKQSITLDVYRKYYTERELRQYRSEWLSVMNDLKVLRYNQGCILHYVHVLGSGLNNIPMDQAMLSNILERLEIKTVRPDPYLAQIRIRPSRRLFGRADVIPMDTELVTQILCGLVPQNDNLEAVPSDWVRLDA